MAWLLTLCVVAAASPGCVIARGGSDDFAPCDDTGVGGQGGSPSASGGESTSGGATTESGGAATGGGPELGGNSVEIRPPTLSSAEFQEELPAECGDAEPRAFALTQEGTARTDQVNSLGTLHRLFDNNSGTSWIVNDHQTPWAAFEFADDAAHVVQKYELVASSRVGENGDALPRSWELEGSNSDKGDGDADWTSLDTRIDELFTRPFEVRSFTVDNSKAYRHYRLRVLDNGGADGFELAELKLFGDGLLPITIDDQDEGEEVNQFTYSASWLGKTLDTNSDRHDGTTSWSKSPEDWAEVYFTGTGIELYAVLDPNHGIMRVTLDGENEELVDLYGPSTAYNVLSYQSPRVCPGDHVLRIEQTEEANPKSKGHHISLDKAVVIP